MQPWFEERWRGLDGRRPQSANDLLVHEAVQSVVAVFRALATKGADSATLEETARIRAIHFHAARIRADLIALERPSSTEDAAGRLRETLEVFETCAVRFGFLDRLDDGDLQDLLRAAGRFRSGLET